MEPNTTEQLVCKFDRVKVENAWDQFDRNHEKCMHLVDMELESIGGDQRNTSESVKELQLFKQEMVSLNKNIMRHRMLIAEATADINKNYHQ